MIPWFSYGSLFLEATKGDAMKVRVQTSVLGPSYMVSGSRDSPPPRTTLSSVYMWKRSLCRSSQSIPCMIIHNLHWIIRCTDIPLPLSFPRSFARSGFCRVNCDLFDTNSWLNSGITWHSTLRELSRLGEPKRARVTLPGEVRQLAHPSCLTSRDGFANLM